jgi:hypothetical protein
MDVAALIAWLVTAGGGFVLLGLWVSKGGLRQQQTGETRFPAPVIFGHFLLAAAGLLVWLGFLMSDESTGLAWTAAAVLVPVALLGFVMVARWWPNRAPTLAEVDPDTPTTVPAERSFPLVLVAAHGAAAVTTIVLVVLAALDAT